MTRSEKSAMCRILFDLIQADLIIDSGEMEHYSILQDRYGINKDDEIAAYGINDKDFIKKEIELIDPDVIICGGSVTINTLDEIYDKSIIKKPSDLVAFYFSDIIGGKERLFIDFYHPAVRYPKVLTYYGVVNLYQQALLLKAKMME